MDELLKLAESRMDTGIHANVAPVGNPANFAGDCKCKCGTNCGSDDCNDC